MNKKLIISILALVLLLGGTATAAVNGVFYGYPIVKVKVNGTTITGDTPAIIFNGRTLVPLAFIGNALGANVTWENSTQTAIVTTAINPISNDSTSTADITKLKYFSYVSYRYDELSTLGSILLFEVDILPTDQKGNLLYSQDDFDNAVILYKGYVSNNSAFISDAKSKGLDVDDTKAILNNYLDCINSLNTAYSYLEDYLSTKNPDSFSSYLINLEKARENGEIGHQKAYDGYVKYYNLIQNY